MVRNIEKKTMADLKLLEKGVKFSLNTYRGSVLVCLGDNLRNHKVGGFYESFGNVEYFCRYCEELTEDLQDNFF